MRVAIVALSGMNLHLDGSSYLGVFVMPQTPTQQAECADPGLTLGHECCSFESPAFFFFFF